MISLTTRLSPVLRLLISAAGMCFVLSARAGLQERPDPGLASAGPVTMGPVTAVPLNAVPLNAVPLNAVPLNAVPLNAGPLNAGPFGTNQMSAVPAIPDKAMAGHSTLNKAMAGSPALDEAMNGSFTLNKAITGLSALEEARVLLDTLSIPDSSVWWPHIQGRLFMENLRNNLRHPLSVYQGSNTNFCGYAALSYIPLHYDPVSYCRFLVGLYRDGRAAWNGIVFIPSKAVRQATGTLRFKGILDIRPADQMWFLVLADHFKSYVNIFNPVFKTGAEDTFWAAVSFGKFNRIVRELFQYNVDAIGSDLVRPWIWDIYNYLSERLHSGGVLYLYVNNTYLHKKNHGLKAGFPTHFIVLTDIRKEANGLLTIIYWDYGILSLREVSPQFLKKILYGVSLCTLPTPNNPPLTSASDE